MANYEKPGDAEINRGLVGYWKLDDLKGTAEDGIVAHYKMNDNAADTNVVDSKSGNTGVCSVNTDTINATGKINGALDFSASEVVTIAESDETAITGDVTMCAWINPNATHTGNIITKVLNGSASRDWRMWIASDTLNSEFNTSDGLEAFGGDTGIIMPGELQHVAVTKVGTLITFYLNGVERGTDNMASSKALNTGSDLVIGAVDDTAEAFDGLIDDVRIYKRGLTASEILEVMVDDQMVAHYKMNDNAADTVVVDSKGGNDGTADANTSTMTAVGKINEAFTFNGTSDEVVLPASNSIITNNNSFTVCLWGKSSDLVSAEGRFITLQTGSSTSTAINIHHTSDDFRASYRDAASQSNTQNLVVGISSDTWYHLAVTYDGTDYKFYANGSLINTITDTFIGFGTGTARLGSFNSSDNFLDGSLDDVRIYEQVLELSEIQALYNSTNGTEETSILATGTETTEIFRETIVAVDRANFNDGTITGATNTTGINGLNADAMFFDGVDDKVVKSSFPAGLMSTSQGSISLWFNEDALSTDTKFLGGFDDGDRMVFRVIESDSGDASASKLNLVLLESAGVWKDAVSASAITAGKWHHACFTWTATSQRVYLDGVPGTATSRSASDFDFGELNIGIGENLVAAGYWNGSIQNFRAYNRVLTDGEISKIARLKL